MYTISFWPILVASVVSFGISALWYSPILFGKDWMELLKISGDDVSRMSTGGVWTGDLIQFIMTLVMFVILGFVMSATSVVGTRNGAFLGFLAWLGFVLPIQISNLLWKGYSLKLVLIESVNYLFVMVAGGAIMGAWR